MRIYLFPANETIMENFTERRNRDRSLWRKLTLLTMEKMNFDIPKITFNQNAGCSCGCSPGFIAEMKNGRELCITYTEVKK